MASAKSCLLGAGLDGRGYRLPWAANTRLFELDAVKMLEFKQAVVDRIGIDARAEIIPVAGDLERDWPTALGDAGFSAEQPTVWVIEGLMGYLTPAENDRLIARVSQRSAPGRLLIAVYVDGDPLTILKSTKDRGDQSTDYLREMVTVGPDAEPEPWLAGHGWTATTSTIAIKRTDRDEAYCPPWTLITVALSAGLSTPASTAPSAQVHTRVSSEEVWDG